MFVTHQPQRAVSEGQRNTKIERWVHLKSHLRLVPVVPSMLVMNPDYVIAVKQQCGSRLAQNRSSTTHLMVCNEEIKLVSLFRAS